MRACRPELNCVRTASESACNCFRPRMCAPYCDSSTVETISRADSAPSAFTTVSSNRCDAGMRLLRRCFADPFITCPFTVRSSLFLHSLFRAANNLPGGDDSLLLAEMKYRCRGNHRGGTTQFGRNVVE